MAFFLSCQTAKPDTSLFSLPDIEVANRHGHTCLMIACYKGHFRIAKYLVEIGANVNRKSVKGNTALHDCAESGSLEIMKLLLNHGANMAVDAYGESYVPWLSCLILKVYFSDILELTKLRSIKS